ncbi:MAG: hypothetical protein AAF441_10070 [Pseudomonadota bacterium]
MKCLTLALSTAALLIITTAPSTAACPPGTRSEGGTGGKGGEEICFGTPTAEVPTRKKKRAKRNSGSSASRPASGGQQCGTCASPLYEEIQRVCGAKYLAWKKKGYCAI